MRSIFRAIPFALLLAACGDAPGRVEVGRPAPALASKALDGTPASLEALRGAPVLLNVWATWCGPCRDEIPALERLHREFGPKGLRIVGVSIDQGGQETSIREFLLEYGATYAIWLDPNSDVTSAFSTMGVPNTFLIGKDGTLLWKHVGPVEDTNPELRALIQKSLSES